MGGTHLYLNSETQALLERIRATNPEFNLAQYVSNCLHELEDRDQAQAEIETNLQEAVARKKNADSLYIYWEKRKAEYEKHKVLAIIEKENSMAKAKIEDREHKITAILNGTKSTNFKPLIENISYEQAAFLIDNWDPDVIFNKVSVNQAFQNICSERTFPTTNEKGGAA